MSDHDLTYSSPDDPPLRRWAMRTIENLSGRRRLLPIYERWRTEIAGKSPRMMNDMLPLIGVALRIGSRTPWPVAVAPGQPLVIVANHPFGIGDGIAALAIAEQLGRPYRVLINNDLLKVPEIRPYALPIDFSETRAALDMNLRSRAEARRLLREGVTIVVFPAGGVATADDWLGKAEELPWKMFTARLVQQAEAAVLPVFFEGQNSRLFHLVSRYSLALRLSLLVSEFRHFLNRPAVAHVGAIVPYEDLVHRKDRRALTEELYLRVQRLDPAAVGKTDDELRPTPPDKRRQYPWDKPRTQGTPSELVATQDR